jgi:16S rRNA processing protein RimM
MRKMTRLERPAERRATDVRLGRIVGRFGLRGELKVDPTKSGTEHLRPGLIVKTPSALGGRELRVAAARAHKRQIVVRFDDIDLTETERLIGADLYAERSGIALKKEEYFDDDLVGCAVVDMDGTDLGDVVDVLHYPAQDMLAVGARRALIPLVGQFIRGIDLERKRIEVDLPDGLIE